MSLDAIFWRGQPNVRGTRSKEITEQSLQAILRHAHAAKPFTGREELCQHVRDHLQSIGSAYVPPESTVHFESYRRACASGQPTIVNAALEALRRLVEPGFLKGDLPLLQQATPGHRILADLVVETALECMNVEEETVQLSVIQFLVTAVATDSFAVHGSTLLASVRVLFDTLLTTRVSEVAMAARDALFLIAGLTFKAAEEARDGRVAEGSELPEIPVEEFVRSFLDEIIDDVELVAGTKPGDTNSPSTCKEFGIRDSVASGFADAPQRDAFLLLRCLCFLSMRPLPDGRTAEENQPSRAKAVVLDVLRGIVEKYARSIRSSYNLIYATKRYLCLSVLRNSASRVPSVFRVSLAIFRTLLSFFRQDLKLELGVFFANVFLRMLERPISTRLQQVMLLQELLHYFQYPKNVVELFLNYDCDVEALDIFEGMVNTFAKMSQNLRTSTDSTTNGNETSILALECLVAMMRALERGSQGVPEHNGGAETSRPSSADRSPLRMFERRQEQKQLLAKAASKFNSSAKKGIQFLREIEGGKTGKDVALFLLTTPGLSKTSLGEYLGENDEFALSVLKEYTEMIDFTGMSFDVALRHYVSHFWLPGESQKIERITNVFASQYCRCNPGILGHPDTGFILAYAIMMLNTSLYNPQVKDRMTKSDFVKMNRGIDCGKDLPTGLLEGIYDNLAKQEIKIQKPKGKSGEDEGEWTDRFGALGDEFFNAKRKSLMFIHETTETGQEVGVHTTAEVVRPMWELAWAPMLAAFSRLLDNSDDPKTISLCLDGFKYAIHVSVRFRMDIQRNSYLCSLAKFSVRYQREMKEKDMEQLTGAFAETIGSNLLQFTTEREGENVLSFVQAVSDDMNKNISNEKVLSVQRSFVGSVKHLVASHRRFIREGPLIKMCRKMPKRRWVFLFNDVLVYASVLPSITNRQMYSFHRMIRLAHTRLASLPDSVGLLKNSFQIISPEKSFSVAARSPEEKTSWMFDLQRAIVIERQRRKSPGPSGTDEALAFDGISASRRRRRSSLVVDPRIISDMFNPIDPIEALEAPVWIPDREAEHCMLCITSFTFFRRRVRSVLICAMLIIHAGAASLSPLWSRGV